MRTHQHARRTNGGRLRLGGLWICALRRTAVIRASSREPGKACVTALARERINVVINGLDGSASPARV
jgi:hypothetical protein